MDKCNDYIEGGADADTITGDDGDDTILGADGNDLISGAAGDDTLEGGMGDDTITGGDGQDTVVFAGNKGDFTFEVAGDGTLTITDLNTQTALGVDTISGVETLRFNDGDLTVTTAQDGYVTLTGTGADDDVTVVGSTAVTLEGVDGALSLIHI